MPRFMGLVPMEEGIGTPPKALFEAMDAHIGERAVKGVFLDGGGLYGTEDAVNFVVREGEVSRIDGPYAEAREVVGGWAIMQYATLDGAVADQREFAELHAKRWPEVTVISTLRQISTGPEEPTPNGDSLRWRRAGTAPTDDPNEAVVAAWRAESAPLVGALTRMTHDVGSPSTLPMTHWWPRTSRAKRTLSEGRAEFELRTGAERARRLHDVMSVVYLISNEGYTATEVSDSRRCCRSGARAWQPASTTTARRSCSRRRTGSTSTVCRPPILCSWPVV